MRSTVRNLLVTGLAALAAAAAAHAAPPDTASLDLGQDHFVAGERVEIAQPVAGDVMAAGRQVTVSANIAGNLLAAGADVQVSSPVHQDVLVTGGEISLASTIDRNARVAGGKVTLQRGARINGNATFAGGELNVAGDVAGHLLAGGGQIYIDGPVGGDVRVAGGDIELGPNARIKGNLRYRSRHELHRSPGAQVSGTVERLPWQEHARARAHVPIIGLLVWSLGLGVVAAILLATMPVFTQRVSSTARTRFGWSLLLGLIAFACIPVALIIALVTVIGIPIALLALLLYPVLLLVGYVLAGVALGDAALRRLKPERAAERNGRIVAALVALLVLGLLARIPLLGGLIGLLALLVGLGALLQQARGTHTPLPAG